MLFSQVFIHTFSYCYLLIESESELVEFCNFEDTESEEEDNKKEKDDKFNVGLYELIFYDLIFVTKNISSEDFLSVIHSEVTTPPPEPSLFLS